MRRIYLVFLFLFVGIVVNAQINLPTVNPQSLNYPLNFNQKNTINKTTSCTDTVNYPQSKITGLPELDTMEISNYISGVAQAFYYTGNGTISGINTYVLLDLDGIPFNSTPIIMTINVYNIDANNYPTTLIATADVQVIDVGFQSQPLMFTVPIAISDSFAVAMEINPSFPANPYYVTNTSANNDGNGEKLSSAEYLGVWYNAYDDFGGWDMDVLLSPIFTQDVISDYSVDTFTTCLGQPVTFTNNSVVNMDYMFNQMTGPSYSWDFGDGMGPFNPMDTTYYYQSSGVFTSELTTTYYGYTLNCMDMFSQTAITIYDTATANFGFAHQGGGLYQFSDSSMSANIYSWDFGDGSPVDNSQNPTHTYATANNYTICLTVTDTNGCNIDTICKVVNFALAVDDYVAPKTVNIYPVPAVKYFNVSVPSNYFGGNIIITDVVGKTLRKIAIENQEKVKVLTDEITSGIYFVSIDYLGERVFTKRIVIDK
jgi:PKD repeat protein